LVLVASFCPFYRKALMQRRNQRRKPRQIASRRGPSRWAEMKASTYPLQHGANWPGPATAEPALEFGRFQVLLRQRQLLARRRPRAVGARRPPLPPAFLCG